MAALMAEARGGRQRHMVNGILTTFVGSRETARRYTPRMDVPFIHGRLALADATELMERFGEEARLQAAIRADRSRDDGNVARFCHWRQIERVIATLDSDEAIGTIH
jgi:hypothetical protein